MKRFEDEPTLRRTSDSIKHSKYFTSFLAAYEGSIFGKESVTVFIRFVFASLSSRIQPQNLFFTVDIHSPSFGIMTK